MDYLVSAPHTSSIRRNKPWHKPKIQEPERVCNPLSYVALLCNSQRWKYNSMTKKEKLQYGLFVLFFKKKNSFFLGKQKSTLTLNLACVLLRKGSQSLTC